MALSIVLWWLALEALGIAFLPITLRLFSGLTDRGYAFGKMLGLLLLGYITWLVEMLQFANFGRATVLFFLVAVAIFAAWMARSSWPELRRFLSQRWMLIVGYELLFLLAFAFLVIFRGFNPEIAGTEKPMDFALINGILRSRQFPPMDPWMSGFSISYYYFGYYLVALLIRLTGVAPAIGFNLGLATVFALTALGAAGLVYNLTRRFTGGVAGAFLVLLSSNPDGLLRVLSYGTLTPQKFWWWWDSSRVVTSGCNGQCIDEFPQFSFMLGDLHPHVMALPIAVLALGIGLQLLRGDPLSWARSHWLPLLVAPIVIGSLGFANTWDLPAYLAVAIGAILLRQHLSGSIDWRPLLWTVGGSFLFYLPFYISFHSQAGGIALVQAQTSVSEFLRMWGFLFLLAAVLLAACVRISWLEAGALAVIAVAVLAIGLEHWLVALLIPLALAALLTIRRDLSTGKFEPNKAFVLGLAALGFALIAVCEVVFLKDTFNNRMNTIFKFYYEAWLVLAVGGGYAVAEIAKRLREHRLQFAWSAAVSVLFLASAVYPAASFYSKAGELRPAWTLDGSAFLKKSNPGDFQAIRWLNETVKQDAVIAEATGPEYSDYARFGTFTGLESILGWAGHELQWRGVWKEQPKRIEDLRLLYTSSDDALVKSLLSTYHVSYVVVGALERQQYGNRDFGEFAKFGKIVFSSGSTTVYQIASSPTGQPQPFGAADANNG